jgi:transcriptional regulator with XRE-family HTH domain
MTGKELKAKAAELDLTEAELAQKLGVSMSDIIKWQREEKPLGKLNKLLELSLSAIEYEADRMTDEEFEAIQEQINEAMESSRKLLSPDLI